MVPIATTASPPFQKDRPICSYKMIKWFSFLELLELKVVGEIGVRSTQKSFDENKILEFLPPKMRTDIAMRVHFSTLGKVKLFRNCEPGTSILFCIYLYMKNCIFKSSHFQCNITSYRVCQGLCGLHS